MNAEEIEVNREEQNNIESIVPSDPNELVTKIRLYEIPEGQILYHGSKTVGTFETAEINFGQNGTTNYISFFTPDRDIAEAQISKCEPMYVGNEMVVPAGGWLHVFRVAKPITNIKLISHNDKDFTWDTHVLTNKYCAVNDNVRLNGFGFFKKKPTNDYAKYFALCFPKEFLTYVGTYQCSTGLTIAIDINNNNVVDESDITGKYTEHNVPVNEEEVYDDQ